MFFYELSVCNFMGNEKEISMLLNVGIISSAGLPDFGIPSIDPLAINSLTIQQGKNSPINLKQDFKNIHLSGISETRLTKYNPDLNNYILRCDGLTPRVDFVGDYTMDGRILLLPITGKGKANITMVGLKTVHELIGEPIKKKGEVYIRFKEYHIKLLPKRVYLHFENLFNGDKVLGENMNRFMNENWELIFNELKGGYEDTFSYVFKDVTNKIFTKVPMNKIFLIDEWPCGEAMTLFFSCNKRQNKFLV